MIQTNRTLLVEEIEPNRDNIVSIVRYIENRESFSDEEIAEIHSRLEVSSFEEVIEKFSPQIYLSLDTDSMQASFHRRLPQELQASCQAIPVCENMAFFDELISLMENKRKRKYVLTAFQNFGDRLLPTKDPKAFWQLREKVLRTVCCEGGHAATKLMDHLMSEYDDGIFLLKTFLRETDRYIQEAVTGNDDLCFVIEDSEDVQVHAMSVSEHFEHNYCHSKQEEETYFSFLNQYFEQHEPKNRNLMVLCMELFCKPKRRDLELLEKYYREYLDFYVRLLRGFWWEAKPLIETLLGIRNFFANYTSANGQMPPKMVITNCTPQQLVDNRYKETFRLYIETVNEKNYRDYSIWYAIIPRLPYVGGTKQNIRERFLSTGSGEHVYPPNSTEGVQVVLDILGKYQVQTFLSIIAGNDTVFHSMRKKGIDSFEESFRFLNSSENREYIIPCYPNFTIIPQEYMLMIPGIRTRYDQFENKIHLGKEIRLWMDEVIVEAAYVAAGLVASYQCPTYLSQYYHDRVIQKDMPGVAYRLCDGDHNTRTKTNMYGEVISYSEEIHNQIERYGKGMIFAPYKGQVIALTDRAHSYQSSTPDNIAIIQTLTYLERVIRYETQDYKEHLIRDFFQERPGSIIVGWKQAADCVNGLLKKEESIEYHIDSEGSTCRFELKFTERRMDDTVRMIK